MRYRARLLKADGTLGDHYKLMTPAQRAKFFDWSLETGRPVVDLMRGLLVEEAADNNITGLNNITIEGTLPNCGLYGVMLPDGSTHT